MPPRELLARGTADPGEQNRAGSAVETTRRLHRRRWLGLEANVSSVSPPTALSLTWSLDDFVSELSKAAKTAQSGQSGQSD
jgi:hypothetical protein